LFWHPENELTKFSGLYQGMLAQVSSMPNGSSVEEMIKHMKIHSVYDTESKES